MFGEQDIMFSNSGKTNIKNAGKYGNIYIDFASRVFNYIQLDLDEKAS